MRGLGEPLLGSIRRAVRAAWFRQSRGRRRRQAGVLTTRAGGGSIRRRKAALSAGDTTVTRVL